MNKLYLRVKDLAAKKKVSLAKVERDLGFSDGIISTWKNGKASQDKINLLADYFDVTTDYLLGRTDTPQFTRKDERDVQKILEEMTQGLNNKNELAFSKERWSRNRSWRCWIIKCFRQESALKITSN